jgi:hypothetical protein
VSKAEETNEPALPHESELERTYLADIKIPPMIQQALDKHRRDLPELMKRYADQWVAYHGDERLEFGRSKRKLYHKYLDRRMSLIEIGLVIGVPGQ